MSFTSFEFLLFLPLALLLYYLLPSKSRWVFLLLSSYIFYAGWKIEYLPLILFSTFIDYSIGLKLSTETQDRKRKLLLFLSIFTNLALLLSFKYFYFFLGENAQFLRLANENENILWLQFIFEYGIPVGISFYTFQTISYTVDLYKRRIEPERNLGKFALYVTFFPQLVAGPIERFSHLHPQLFTTKKFIWENFRMGFQLILVGFFLKMVIGDNLGEIIAPIFENPESYSLAIRWFGVVLFALEIYADFNGYSLIALGCAKLLGVDLMTNFKRPYGSFSIREFWSRWHISLSTWFRDYVYLPLGGSKSNKYRWFLAILITFFLSGFWHGASTKFIVWGLIHGTFYLIEQQFFPVKKDETYSFLNKFVRWTVTMSVVVLGWLFFRINKGEQLKSFFSTEIIDQKFIQLESLFLIPLVYFLLFEIWNINERPDRFLGQKTTLFRWGFYSVTLLIILLFASTGDIPFIYFQF